MTITDKYVFFWGGEFSQWYVTSFIDCEDNEFISAEQFMMYHKAKVFDDVEMMQKIMASEDQSEIKGFGRLVKNFDETVWNNVKQDIVLLGNLYKFGQNVQLRRLITIYSDHMFVEASPYDKIWGIGMKATHPDASDPSKWRGQNLLGKTIDMVATIFKNRNLAENLQKLEEKLYEER